MELRLDDDEQAMLDQLRADAGEDTATVVRRLIRAAFARRQEPPRPKKPKK